MPNYGKVTSCLQMPIRSAATRLGFKLSSQLKNTDTGALTNFTLLLRLLLSWFLPRCSLPHLPGLFSLLSIRMHYDPKGKGDFRKRAPSLADTPLQQL